MAMAMESIKMTTSAAEEPAVAGSSSVAVGDDVFERRGAVDPPALPSSEDERDNEGAVLGDEEDDPREEGYVSSNDGDDVDIDDEDVDSEFEEDDEVAKVVKNGDVLAAPCKFLGQPALIASVQSTVCFMNLFNSSAPLCQCHGGGGEIIVDYRYTRFYRAPSGGGDGDGDGDGVDMHVLGPKQARLRFVVRSPLASDSDSDPATMTTVISSLRFAGAVLASLVYPARFSAQLRALWSAATTAVPFRVPARTTSLLVTVDAGILRPGDCTPAHMMRMREALESAAAERAALPPDLAITAELRLPALLIGSEDDVRPTKRRRVTGEDCPICFEALEEGLAASPRCSHIFHGGCLEQHLLRGHQECPLCRSELKLSSAPCGK